MYIITQNRTLSFLSNSNVKRGFTLIELIVGMALGLLLIVMITTVFAFGLKRIREIEQSEALHSNVLFVLNTITYWVKQGESLDTSTPGTLIITIPNLPNPKIINSATFTDNNIQIENLVFIKMAYSVRVTFNLNGGETFTTTIAQRNI